MDSCCVQNEEKERQADLENLKKQAKVYATKYLFEGSSFKPMEIKEGTDQRLQEIFQKFIHIMNEQRTLPDQGILVLADSEARVFTFASKEDIPDVFHKEESAFFDWSIESIGLNAIGLTAKSGTTSFILGKEHYLQLLQAYDTMAVPVFNNHQQLTAVIGYISLQEEKKNGLDYLKGLLLGVALMIGEDHQYREIQIENQKRDALYLLTQKLYGSFDIKEVLSEAIHSITTLYPNVESEILLTQEYNVPNVPIKQMAFIPSKEDISGQAFLEGKVIKRSRKNEKSNELAAPLKGKQGIYGVLHLSCDESCCNSDDKVQFVSNIADIIGTAFENARLYEQSIYLVKELQVINELTKRMNQSLEKEAILQFVISELIRLYNARYVNVAQIEEEQEVISIIASNIEQNVGMKLPLHYGYMGYVYQNKESLIIADVIKDQKIQDHFVKQIGCRSLIAVPIEVRDEIIGILSVSSIQTHHFSYDNLKMLQLFAQHLGLALTNALLHEKIQFLAIIDYLTGLYNRSYLDEKIVQSQHDDQMGVLLLFDVDDFKKVNDTYGHQIGDDILIQVADILNSSIRKEDIAARWGGEELALYLPNSNIQVAQIIAKRILERIRSETDPRITVSCGISYWKKDDQEVSHWTLVKKADDALYRAKNQGKDQVIIYTA